MKLFLQELGTVPSEKLAVAVISDPEWDGQQTGSSMPGVVDLCQRLGYSLLAEKDVAASTSLEFIEQNDSNIVMVLGWRSIIPESFLARFGGLVFNMHTADLPRFRGAGGFSWQVLHNINEVCITFHQMTAKLDAGDIWFQSRATISEEKVYPQSVLTERFNLCRNTAFPQLVSYLTSAKEIELRAQQIDDVEFYPILNTPTNGLIDFSWNVEAVESFIRAFSYPYPGASFQYADKVFRVRESTVMRKEQYVHPFCLGLLANVTKAGIHVLLENGVLRFENITDETGTEVPFDRFRVGNRFFNTPEQLLAAKLYRAPN